MYQTIYLALPDWTSLLRLWYYFLVHSCNSEIYKVTIRFKEAFTLYLFVPNRISDHICTESIWYSLFIRLGVLQQVFRCQFLHNLFCLIKQSLWNFLKTDYLFQGAAQWWSKCGSSSSKWSEYSAKQHCCNKSSVITALVINPCIKELWSCVPFCALSSALEPSHSIDDGFNSRAQVNCGGL